LTKLDQIRAAESRLLITTYDRNPLLFVRGQGVYIIDEQGERYLDLLSGIGVNALGYNHPVIEEAIARQSRALIHTSNLYFHEGQAELALHLTEQTGLDRVFFSNTGTEAWECAMKLARAYAGLKRGEGKQIGTKFLALEQSFHGRTFGAISTTYKEKYREPFDPVVPGVEFVRFNDVADLRAKFSPKSAPFSSKPFRAKAASVRSRRNFSPKPARWPTPPARCLSSMRFRPAWAAPASGAPISITAFNPTSPLLPSH